jgi:hypothetical protein
MRSSGAPLRRKKELQCGEMRKIEREERRNEDTGFWEGCSLSSICRTLLGIAEESRTLGAFGTRPPTSFMQTKPPESFAPCRVRSSPIADALAHIDNYHPPVSLERQMRRIALYCLSCASSPIFQERTGANGQAWVAVIRRLFIPLTDTSLARGFGAVATTTPRKVDLVDPTPIGE